MRLWFILSGNQQCVGIFTTEALAERYKGAIGEDGLTIHSSDLPEYGAGQWVFPTHGAAGNWIGIFSDYGAARNAAGEAGEVGRVKPDPGIVNIS
jgi:hypothetical protein